MAPSLVFPLFFFCIFSFQLIPLFFFLSIDTVPSDWIEMGRWDGGPEKPQSWLRELVSRRGRKGKECCVVAVC